MEIPVKANIAVKPNIYCDPVKSEWSETPYFLQEIIPGDLLVEFLGTINQLMIKSQLTRQQEIEYQQSRFFQNHGQEGVAFKGLQWDNQKKKI